MSSPRVNKVLVTLVNIFRGPFHPDESLPNKATLIVLQSDVQSAQF